MIGKFMSNIIVAHSDNNVIGKNGKIPWSKEIKKIDQQFFKIFTTGDICIMGRKTFETFKKPLPNRIMFILSKKGIDKNELNSDFKKALKDGTLKLFSSFSEITNDVEKNTEKYWDAGVRALWCIGGGELYRFFSHQVEVDITIRTRIDTIIAQGDAKYLSLEESSRMGYYNNLITDTGTGMYIFNQRGPEQPFFAIIIEERVSEETFEKLVDSMKWVNYGGKRRVNGIKASVKTGFDNQELKESFIADKIAQADALYASFDEIL